MNNEIGYFFDSKFEQNILFVEQMGCGKITFVQNLAKNKKCLLVLKKFTGYLKYLFPGTEKKIYRRLF